MMTTAARSADNATSGAVALVDPFEVRLTGTRELRSRTPLLHAFVTCAVAGLVAAVALRRPELVALSAPLAVAVAVAVAGWRPIEGTVRIGVDAHHIVEGDEFAVIVEVSAESHELARVEIGVELGDRITSTGHLRAVTSVPAGTTRQLVFPVQADLWGIATIEQLTVRVTDRFGFFGGHLSRIPESGIRIGLNEDRLSGSLDADRFRRVVGSHLSAERGEGMEIADVRQYLPGDSMRDINWRISNRRGEPWVTLRHPDRSATVVLVVDAHDGLAGARIASQRRSVEAAMALARGHLANHDPVGLLVVGHSVSWLPPRLGRNQRLRIADELITVSNAPDASLRLYRPPAVHNISRESIVVAVTPLRDPLMVSLIAELRNRGNPVLVLVPADEAAALTRRSLERPATSLARRLASVERRVGEHSLRSRGVVLMSWSPGDPVTVVIDAVTRLRRSARGARR